MATKKAAADGSVSVDLDLTGIEKDEAPLDLRVVAQFSDGRFEGTEVAARPGSVASVKVPFSRDAGGVRLLVGPATATDEELVASETISVDLSAAVLEGRQQLAPIVVSPWYWWWWRRWCREFVVRGKVVCADGSPVPGAEVCAFDVDWWWWWSSLQQVGCATTDVNGTFEIRFRWCCFPRPWWWWRSRIWQVDHHLADRIRDVLERDPRIELARSDALPSLRPFGELLGRDGVPTHKPLVPELAPELERIRGPLLDKLPVAPELAELRIWPWFPWFPWRDCTPDLIFRVTQDFVTPGTVIVDETAAQVRWNIPNPLDVVLIANEDAVCKPDCPERPCIIGRCLDIARVCGIPVNDIGGNAGAPSPDGYADPGVGDRPFAETVTVEKANIFTGVDYYEIEIDSGGGFGPLPPGMEVGFHRSWLQPPHPPTQPLWQAGSVPFPVTVRSGHSVYESREHYEATVGLPTDAFWTTNADLVTVLDSTKVSDGTYSFRVVGWSDDGSGGVTDRIELPVCGTELVNSLVLTFDNRTTGGFHPQHPCGPGTVHVCTDEPDCGITKVSVDGVAVGTCETVEAGGSVLEIEFTATDPDGHLAAYSLVATFGLNQVVDLLNQPSSTLSLVAGSQVGPSYATALAQGATSPTWAGGTYRLTIDADEAFPIPCCYQLELRTSKRPIVSCSSNFAYENLTEYTIGVGVCPPRPLADLPELPTVASAERNPAGPLRS